MPSASELYGGQWLKASDLTPLGQRRNAVINDANPEIVGQDQKQMLALTLASSNGKIWPKRVLLNKTNMMQLVTAYSDDYGTWIGRSIEIWSENVMFQSSMRPGIKILPASRRAAPAPAAPPPTEVPPDADPDTAISDDEIPF